MKKSTLILSFILSAMSVNGMAQKNSSASVGSASSTGYSQTKGDNTVSKQTYTSTNSDENAVQVTGGTLTMTNCTIKKTAGDTGDSDGSSFYGINSAVYCAGSSSILTMTGGTINTSAKGANSIIAYNSGTINVSNVTINNTANLSRGIHATGGGKIVASNLAITTAGSNSSVIATDRGGGTVTVTGGSYITTGTDCAVTYSTGTITVTDATGSSSKGEVGVIEGDNTITLNNCTMTSGSSTRGMMILQSGSGDATGYNGKITVNGGTITLTGSDATLCEVPTNITGTLTLKDVTLTVPSGNLMKVDYNTRWKTYGGTGNLVLTSDATWTYTGTVSKDSYGTVNVTVGKGVTWVLSANTTVNTLTVQSGATINTNGFTLNYTTLSNNGTIINSIDTIDKDTRTDGKVYTIQGVKVQDDATDISGLPKGMYIVSGKKFVKN